MGAGDLDLQRAGWLSSLLEAHVLPLLICSPGRHPVPRPHLRLFIIWQRYLQGPATQPCSNFSLPGPHCSKKLRWIEEKKGTSWVVFQPSSPLGRQAEGLWNESQEFSHLPRGRARRESGGDLPLRACPAAPRGGVGMAPRRKAELA